mgnify:CR=1 FL=1
MSSDIPLTSEDVAEIVAILDGSQYERLEIRTGRFRLKVAREGSAPGSSRSFIRCVHEKRRTRASSR